jgi:hypothetical protein
VGPWCQPLLTRNLCYIILFCLSWLMATWLLFLNPHVKFELVKVENAADRWVLGVGLFEQWTCAIWIYFLPRDCCRV